MRRNIVIKGNAPGRIAAFRGHHPGQNVLSESRIRVPAFRDRLTLPGRNAIVDRRFTINGSLVTTKRASERKCESGPVGLPEDDCADELAQLAWAVAHPARVRIVRLLIHRKACVCGEIVAQLPLAQSTVSQHLKILKESGMIQGEIDGPKTCYCINEEKLNALKKLVSDL